MFLVVRVVTYAAAFIGFVLIYLPANVLSLTGIERPAVGAPQIVGLITGAAGAVLAVACIVAFAALGKGTPAPFDPPRRLVIRGPYRFVRNPMYLGAAVALGSAALFYESPALLGYAVVFLIATHLFVVAYEEPTLRRTFGHAYDVYCRDVGRWLPRLQRLDKGV